jgi:hypothetical protein
MIDMIAAQSGHADIVEYLLVQSELKTDVNIRDTDNHTPLILACGVTKAHTTDSLIKVIHLLLAGGATVNAEDEGGYTALDLAVINNNIEAVKLLLEYKCNVNHQNQDSFTPLHSACRYHFQEIASMLVSAGADLSIPDGQGRTPIQLAQRYGVVLSLSSPQTSPTPTATAPSNSTSTPSAPFPPHAQPPTKPPHQDQKTSTLATTSLRSGGRVPATEPVSVDAIKALQAELEAEIETTQTQQEETTAAAPSESSSSSTEAQVPQEDQIATETDSSTTPSEENPSS